MIMVEEGTTNLFTNPGWLDGTLTGWAKHSDESATGIRTVESDSKYGYRLKLERTGGQPSDRFGILQTKTWSASGSSLTFSVYFNVVSAEEGAKLCIYTDFRNPSNTPYWGRGVFVDLKTLKATPVYGGKASVQALEDGWYYFTYTPSETDNCWGPIYFWIEGRNAQIYLAWSQLEAKPYPTSFIDGTRSAESLTIPTAGLTPEQGTIEGIFECNKMAKRTTENQWNNIFDIPTVSNTSGIMVWHNSTSWRLETRDDSGTSSASAFISDSLTPDGPIGYRVSWSPAKARLEFWSVENDVFKTLLASAEITNPKLPSAFASNMYIGCQNGSVNFLNTSFGRHRLSNIVRTDVPDLIVDANTIAVLSPTYDFLR